MTKNFATNIKTGLSINSLIMLLIAFIAYTIARLLHAHMFGRIRQLRRIPEVSDLTVMILGSGFITGSNGQAVVIGAGMSLIRNLMRRAGITIRVPR